MTLRGSSCSGIVGLFLAGPSGNRWAVASDIAPELDRNHTWRPVADCASGGVVTLTVAAGGGEVLLKYRLGSVGVSVASSVN